MADEARVLDALGDGTRRELLERLAHGEQSVASLTAVVPVSQSAVSQHLKVLKEAGLVIDRPAGTRRLYRVDRDGFEALRAYLDRFWDEALGEFAAFAESQPPPTAPPSRPTTKRSS